DYDEAIRLEPKYAAAFNNRGNVWDHKRVYDKALADYDEAIRLEPRYATAFINRAWLWATCPDARLRDAAKAVQSATRACELDGGNAAEDIGTRAGAYAEAGDFAKAVEFQEKANGLYTSQDQREKGERRLKLYREGKPYRDQ